jgi:hypothetical protein
MGLGDREKFVKHRGGSRIRIRIRIRIRYEERRKGEKGVESRRVELCSALLCFALFRSE